MENEKQKESPVNVLSLQVPGSFNINSSKRVSSSSSSETFFVPRFVLPLYN